MISIGDHNFIIIGQWWSVQLFCRGGDEHFLIFSERVVYSCEE